MSDKKCILCDDTNPIFDIHHYNKEGIPIYRNQCRKCRTKITGTSFIKRRQNNQITKDKDNLRKRKERQDPNKRARFILEDSRKGDKKKNRQNDLDLDFIKKVIEKGCSYCGENEIKICLDRIDNSKGHLKDNVIAACVRCNNIKNSMPYEAWLHIVPSIKSAYENGLFDNWHHRLW